jgi:kumamolisin
MASPGNYKPIQGTEPSIPKEHKLLKATPLTESITVTLILRRRKSGTKMRAVKDFAAKANAVRAAVDRHQFVANHGADPADIEQVQDFAKSAGLSVIDTNQAARSIVLRGTTAKINKAFGVKLNTYQGALGKYHSHTGPAKLPASVAPIVQAVVGLHNPRVRARAFNTTRRRSTNDPPNTQPVTPQQMAQFYGFPPGDGAGQTIGIYEMTVEDPQTSAASQLT